MNESYWLGVATPFAVAGALYLLGSFLLEITRFLYHQGFFLDWDKNDVDEQVEYFYGKRQVKRVWKIFGHGKFEYTGSRGEPVQWSSRWFYIGPLSIGKKRDYDVSA